jgi:hypothetical protein
MNGASILRAALVAWLAALTGSAVANPAAASVAPAPCVAPRAIIVIDDQLNQPAWIAEQMRAFRLESPAAAVRAALDKRACIALLDADPVFASIPGAAAPELVARVRVVELAALEKTFARRATDAVGRYVSSYFGDSGDGIPALRQVELGGELLCARGRNLLQSASAKGALVDDGLPADNRKRIEEAAALLAGLLLRMIAEAPEPCHHGNRGNTEKERP